MAELVRQQRVGGGVQVRVAEDDPAAVTAQLECELLQRAGRVAHEQLADAR